MVRQYMPRIFYDPPEKPSATPPPPSYIRNVRYLTEKFQIFLKRLSAHFSVAKYQMSKSHYSIDITSVGLYNFNTV